MRREEEDLSWSSKDGLSWRPLNAIYLHTPLFRYTQDAAVPVFSQIWGVPHLFKNPLMNAPLLSSCIMFHVKARIKYKPSFQASPTQTRTYTHVYPAKHGPAVSGCLLMLSQSTWAVAWPANHNICRLVFTTVWTLLFGAVCARRAKRFQLQRVHVSPQSALINHISRQARAKLHRPATLPPFPPKVPFFPWLSASLLSA